ncbi:MAG: hypothetical protein EA384_06720 [Spirochaetaceae bacterium]|nr:MAG: hypothetical protein EA384_06720 [Spirochaetaceae bacterium]
MNKLTVFALSLIVPWALVALEVDREELESQITRTVEFENYQGPYERVDTIEAIRGIGVALAAGPRAAGETADYFARYQIIRAVDPDVRQGLDADILVILDGARVDHIDNIRRILAAYLEEAYRYSSAQAWLIAEFVTIYNAIYRGEIDFFGERYKPIVIRNVSADNVGIATRYSEWPGRTRLVTPLRAYEAPGVIGAVDALALTDQRVVEELRTRPDMALEERREMVDLVERSIEEDELRIEREQREITSEREAAERERERLEAEREAVAEALEREEIEAAEAERRERELEERERMLVERQEEIVEREQIVEREREEVQRRVETVRERREEIAEDTRTVMERAPVALVEDVREVLFIQTRMRAGRPLGQLLMIDGATATVLRRSQLDTITSRRIERWGNDHLLIAEHGGHPRLMRIDSASLVPTTTGSAELFPESIVVPRPDRGEIFAIVRDGAGWYLGKFNGSLALLERSSVEVDPFTHIVPVRDLVFVQGADGAIVGLSLEDLRR